MNESSIRTENVFIFSLSGLNYFKEKDLFYKLNFGYMPGMPVSGEVSAPPENDWQDFWRELDRLDVWDWHANDWIVAFPEREGAAGCGLPFFYSIIANDGKIVLAQASNRYPPHWTEFYNTVESLFKQGNPLRLAADTVENLRSKPGLVHKAVAKLASLMCVNTGDLLLGRVKPEYKQFIDSLNETD